MRLQSVTAPDHAQAMMKIRASLGDDAVIVASQELKGGGVRVTAAVEQDDVDLAGLLAPPPEETKPAGWLAGLAAHHEIPAGLAARLQDVVAGMPETEPPTALGHALHSLLRFAPLAEASGVPLLLTGPPGVGKTASIAKLAARAVIAGRSVRVITTDATRAGGIEQLGALLGPLRLAPESASDAAALRQTLAAADADVVLIDSPGLNPFRPADLGQVSGLIEASRAEPVLVLAGGLAVSDCGEIGHTYAALGAERMLVTKLDASRRLGGVLAAADAGVAFAAAGIGPTIGQGLAPLSAPGLARLLLHAQAVGARDHKGPAAAAGRAVR